MRNFKEFFQSLFIDHISKHFFSILVKLLPKFSNILLNFSTFRTFSKATLTFPYTFANIFPWSLHTVSAVSQKLFRNLSGRFMKFRQIILKICAKSYQNVFEIFLNNYFLNLPKF